MKQQFFAPDVSEAPIIDVKAVSDDGEFEGYASVFGVVDLGRDIVLPGAFAKSLAERGPDKVKMLWNHDASQPIGKWSGMEEDQKGLKVRGKLNLKVSKAAEIHALMQDKAIDGMSIGFRTLDDEYDRNAQVRRLKEVDLWEISLVTFAMNPKATVTAVKGANMTEREFERLMQDAGFSRSEARAVMAQGFKALKGTRDAADGDANRLLNSIERLSSIIKA